MENIIHFLVLLPFAGFLLSLLVPARNEAAISRITFFSTGIHFAVAIGFVTWWLTTGAPVINMKDLVVFEAPGYAFFIDLLFDRIAAAYLLTGSFLTFLVAVYSRYYMHREPGYKRFFNTILFFFLAYNITVLSGNLETLFIGWEMLGISSFLLIAFYRDRYLPVRNAVKVFSIYRIGDVGLILAMWLTHHLFHENITFLKLSNYTLVHTQLQEHSMTGVCISLMILVTAAAKSAQLPFSSWLPRAMEGPTPSSAIFYGSLSVHLGVFLLLRTFPFWEHQLSVRIAIGMLGLATSIVTTGIARVQSSVKSQIAYASAAQIGLIFVEVAAGLHTLALIHFAGNAFLRTYQLLISPSVVSYLIREQSYRVIPEKRSVEDSFPKRLQYTFYVLCLREWNLDNLMRRFLWNPVKRIGNIARFITLRQVMLFFIPAYVLGLASLYFEGIVPESWHPALTFLFAFIGLAMVLKSFTERKSAVLSWLLIIMNHCWIALAVSFNEHFSSIQTSLYLSGVIVAGLAGLLVLRALGKAEGNPDLLRYHGHVHRHKGWAFLFLLACLGLSGFPVTPTFIGEDLVFSHIHEEQAMLAFFAALSFVLDGLAIIRIYSRVFLGPDAHAESGAAFRSS